MRTLMLIVLALAAVYGVVVGAVKVNERALVFQAERAKGPLAAPDAKWQLPVTRVAFAAADSTKLVGWVVPGAMPDSNGTWVIVNHGNAHNISQLEEPEFLRDLRATGVNILAYDYRGFGESGGTPDEQGLYADGHAAYQLLRTKYGVPAERIIAYGHSLGTGVAVELASTVPLGGLVLHAPYTSIPDLGAERFPYLPVRQISAYRFASLERIPKITVPLLVLHSPGDKAVPLAMGERIYAASGSKDRRMMHVAGGHELAFRVDSAIFFRAFREMVNRVTARADSIERLHRRDPGIPTRPAPEPTGGRPRG